MTLQLVISSLAELSTQCCSPRTFEDLLDLESGVYKTYIIVIALIAGHLHNRPDHSSIKAHRPTKAHWDRPESK
jgi:hypothetical protein